MPYQFCTYRRNCQCSKKVWRYTDRAEDGQATDAQRPDRLPGRGAFQYSGAMSLSIQGNRA